MIRKILIMTAAAAAMVWTGGESFAQPKQSLSDLMLVVQKQLVSKTHAGLSDFQYEYTLTAENNTDTDYSGVFITAASAAPNVQIIDGTATLGAFNASSQKQAADTIKIQVDRTIAFDPNSLVFAFDNDTLAGIDANGNGLRDDIEVILQSRYGKTKTANLLGEYAKLVTAQMVQSAGENHHALIRRNYLISKCLSGVLQDSDNVELDFFHEVVNTDARLNAYDAFRDSLEVAEFTPTTDQEVSTFCNQL